MASPMIKRLTGIAAGSALALGSTVLLSSPAEAAPSVWDKVAACESSGNWAINTGNGYYGGLQFSPRTWKGFGGKSYASQAHQATKAEQITIAQRVLAEQGPGAWPTCGRRAGLTRVNGAPGAQTAPSAPVASAPTAKPTPAPAPKKHPKKVTVRAGDTLAKIAHRHHVRGGWKALWKLNKKKLHNPNQLKIGWKLIVKKY